MRLKKGVKINGLKPEIIVGLIICDSVYESHSVEMVVTCGSNGKHRDFSDHYKGYAVDLRTSNIPPHVRNTVLTECQSALGEDFVIVYEEAQPHFHLGYKPREL